MKFTPGNVYSLRCALTPSSLSASSLNESKLRGGIRGKMPRLDWARGGQWETCSAEDTLVAFDYTGGGELGNLHFGISTRKVRYTIESKLSARENNQLGLSVAFQHHGFETPSPPVACLWNLNALDYSLLSQLHLLLWESRWALRVGDKLSLSWTVKDFVICASLFPGSFSCISRSHWWKRNVTPVPPLSRS